MKKQIKQRNQYIDGLEIIQNVFLIIELIALLLYLIHEHWIFLVFEFVALFFTYFICVLALIEYINVKNEIKIVKK